MARPGGAPENLIPVSERTPEELKEMTSKGGRASAKRKREAKTWREITQALLQMPIGAGRVEKFRNIMDSAGKNLTAEQAIVIKQVVAAINGDLQAAIFVRDTSGNKPKDEIALSHADSEVNSQIEKWFKENS